jgi:hypothetical protein
MTDQHLLGLNIFAITELTITTLFCLNVKCVKSCANKDFFASPAS